MEMRILLFAPDAPGKEGHSFLYARKICESLVGAGAYPLLVAGRSFSNRLQSLGPNACPPYEVVECPVNFKVVDRIRRAVPGTLGEMLFAAAQCLLTLAAFVFMFLRVWKRKGPKGLQVVHFLSFEPLTFLVFLPWLKRMSQSSHLFVNIHRVPGIERSLLRRLHCCLASRTLARLCQAKILKGVFVHSDVVRQELLNWGRTFIAETPVWVAPYGAADPVRVTREARTYSKSQLGFDRGQKVAMVWGMIRREKRIDLVFRALAHTDPSVVLLCAGVPWDVPEKEIRSWALTCGVADRVRFHLAYIEESQVGVFFQAADCLVVPYAASHIADSGPVKLACTYGLPVVAAANTAIGRFVQGNGIGLCCDVENPEEFARAIEEAVFLADDRLERIRNSLYTVAEASSWKNTVQAYLRAYRGETS